MIPYPSAVAVVSLMRRRSFNPAISAASMRLLRCASVNQGGQLTTMSETGSLSSAEAVDLTLLRNMETS